MNDGGMLSIRALALSLSTEMSTPFRNRLVVFALNGSRDKPVMPSHPSIVYHVPFHKFGTFAAKDLK
jgi:hypothetical protein